jgi:hypothetical protein
LTGRRRARFKVWAARTDTPVARPATVFIDRVDGVEACFAVRPHGRRREYTIPLATVAEIVVQRIIKAEVAEARAAKKKGRKA